MSDETDPTPPDVSYADKAKQCGLLDRFRGKDHQRARDRDWLVESILLPRRPFVIGGAEKCLKTNIALAPLENQKRTSDSGH
jgi:hypothetical protein